MFLSPQEIDKLTLHQAGFLAQKRLARGTRLNYPEAVALIATQLLELVRDGRSVAALMDLGKQMLGRRQVMDGVAEMIHDVQVEGTFPDGSKLVTVHQPIVRDDGDLALALYGSFLPVPALATFMDARDAANAQDAGAAGGTADARGAAVASNTGAAGDSRELVPGAITAAAGVIELNAHRRTLAIAVTNTGDRPIQVGSHYPFDETNRALAFDRAQAHRMRLDIPAGTAVRFEPGETRTVPLVAVCDAEAQGVGPPTAGRGSSPVGSTAGVP